jgi:hypothetical protein
MKVVYVLHACLWQTSHVQRHLHAAIGLSKRSGAAYAGVVLFGKLELFCVAGLLGFYAISESSYRQQRGYQNRSANPLYCAHDSFLPVASPIAQYTGFLLANPTIYSGLEFPCRKYRE